jgi:hypothetical protein
LAGKGARCPRRSATISGLSRRGMVARYQEMSGCIMPKPAAESTMRSGKMISRVDIYIFRQVLFALVVTTGALTALIWLTQSLRFVDLVV